MPLEIVLNTHFAENFPTYFFKKLVSLLCTDSMPYELSVAISLVENNKQAKSLLLQNFKGNFIYFTEPNSLTYFVSIYKKVPLQRHYYNLVYFTFYVSRDQMETFFLNKLKLPFSILPYYIIVF